MSFCEAACRGGQEEMHLSGASSSAKPFLKLLGEVTIRMEILRVRPNRTSATKSNQCRKRAVTNLLPAVQPAQLYRFWRVCGLIKP